MNKIYHVIIKGKTLESRDLKELLARAVSEKRNLDRKFQYQTGFHGQASVLCDNPRASVADFFR
jgi:hypothetical protein